MFNNDQIATIGHLLFPSPLTHSFHSVLLFDNKFSFMKFSMGKKLIQFVIALK
jgi:hypothetical protein